MVQSGRLLLRLEMDEIERSITNSTSIDCEGLHDARGVYYQYLKQLRFVLHSE